MSTGARLGPVPGFSDPGDDRRVRDVLAGAGYSEAGLRETLGDSDLMESRRLDLPPRLRRIRGGTSLHTLIRLFFLGVSVEVEAARRAVHPMAIEDWAGAGLLALGGGEAAPLVKVAPYRDLLLASDISGLVRAGAPEDLVIGVGKSSALVAHTMIRRPARRTLDLGSGCGVLALVASRYSDRVHATDKNPRATGFAAFNARLNSAANVECATGDLFEPVADQRFDLIVCNPPYVIAPTLRYLFSDSGVRGDEFCRRLVRLAAASLEEGGYAQIMSNWTHGPGQAWQDHPVVEWFDGTGCDVLVWPAGTQDSSSYALNWIQQTEADHPDRLPGLYDAWMRYYDREGIEAVTYGLITMRRTSGRPGWTRFARVPDGSAAPDGEHILRRFQAQDLVDSAPGDAHLLDRRFRLAPDLQLEQHYAPGPGGLRLVMARLHLAREAAYHTMAVEGPVAAFIMCHRDDRRLLQVLEAMATTMQVDMEEMVPAGLSLARQLLLNGYLLPVDPRT